MEHSASCSDDLSWVRSSYSGTSGGDCVEVAAGSEAVHVRDSKAVAGAVLTFGRAEWGTFLAYAQGTDAPRRSG